MSTETQPKSVTKSINDERDYKVIELPNKLICLLVHDKDADKSSASLSVKIGYHQDPTDRPGLAHFLEHMLFLGTEKYPAQDEYANYISSNSGARNAYTSAYETNYYFDCANPALYGALDRFAQFFTGPLFTESCTQREINAVNSEHEKNILQDNWRSWQLFRSTSKEGHIYNRFGTGSRTTLDQPTIRENLLDFHKKYYSANLMKAAIYGKEDLSKLEEWAHEFFGPIKSWEVDVPRKLEAPFTEENLGSFWKVFPINDKDLLEFVWIIEDLEPHYKNNPGRYISHLLGHEGPNSILSYLMDEGLAIALSAGYMPERGIFSVITVEIELTKKGLENYKHVCNIVFSYLKMLREKGANERIFEEIKKISKFQFDYKDKEKPIGYTTSLVSRMHNYPIEDVLKIGYLMEDYKPDLIEKTINSLTTKNVRIYLTSKSVEKDCNQTEKWYGTKYSCEPFNEELRNILENPKVNPSKSGKVLDLPPLNHFIPENFDLFAKDFASLPNYPEKVYESKIIETYFKQDNKFKKPKAAVTVKLYCNDLGFGHNLKTFTILGLWLKLFKESLREILYQAETAKLHIDIDRDNLLNGIKFYITGFNDSIDKICVDLFEKFKSFNPSNMKDEFANFKQGTLEDIKNISKKPPYLQTLNLLSVFLNCSGGTAALPEVMYEKVQGITFEDVLSFHQNFFKTIWLESFFIGNLTREKAIETTKHIESILSTMRPGTRHLPKDQLPDIRMVNVQPNSTWFYEKTGSPMETGEKESNSCLACYYQFEEHETNKKLLLDVLSNYLKSPCFNMLRTDEQLGYIVHSSTYNSRNVLGFIVLIQSNVRSSHFISQRVDAFLDKMKEKIATISEEEFKKYVESVRVTIAQKDLSIIEEGNRFWQEVNQHKYIFNRKEVELEALSALTKEQLVDIFEEVFYRSRRLLEFHLVSDNHMEENGKIRAERVANQSNIKSASTPEELRKKLPQYPDLYLPAFNSNV